MRQKPKKKSKSLIGKDGQINFDIRTHHGRRKAIFQDFYHFIFTTSWPALFGWILLLYLVVNACFAGLYVLSPQCITTEHPLRFTDAFFFSVQTLSTIGYGNLAPANIYANILVTIESALGLVLSAAATGVCFAKFSRQKPRLLFSDNVLITEDNGQPCLIFRVANERHRHMIMEANLRLTVILYERKSDGRDFNNLYDLKLRRSTAPIFALSWTVFHPLDEDSPIRDISPRWAKERNLRLIVTLQGVDDTLSLPVYAKRSYDADDIVYNARFEDILSGDPKGEYMFADYTKFSQWKSLDPDRKHEQES